MKQITSENDFNDLAQNELGARSCKGPITISIVNFLSFLWALFQLVTASPLPFWLAVHFGISDLVINDVESRSVHLAFALFLSFLSFPAFHSSPIQKVPILDWGMAVMSSLCAIYLFIFYEDLAERVALPSSLDMFVSWAGILLLLEAARRAIGAPIAIVAVLFLSYSYFGEFMPEILLHKGHSLESIASHEWLSSEGVFGVALGVSCSFIFLYVLFGALLDKAGAGSFFLKLSFALLGRFTGGPAKAAVVASGLMGMISGSSIANTITIGTFTIPMMKRMGLSSEKAAAIEVSAGINGQIMPPVMGAAAFLMSEFLSIPYADIVKYAFVPAILVYVTLLYIVHLEACKIVHESAAQLPVTKSQSIYRSMLMGCLSFCVFTVICGVIYFIIQGVFGIPGIKEFFGNGSVYVISLMMVIAYCGIVYYQSVEKQKDEDEVIDETHIPSLWHTLKHGLHYFIPISILIWCLIVERMSSSLSCFWTICFLIFVLLTQNFLHLYFSSGIKSLKAVKLGLINLYHAMLMASKNMMAIAVATGTAGIIVGSVSLTGFGLSISGVIDSLASGSLLITLLMTAAICIVLGMGMPTTACYIIVSTLMVPVLKDVVVQNGLDISPFALHLFVFYFGLMADVTPPVGLASYAAAAIAKGNTFKTGVQAFVYNIRTMLLPFLFVYNPELILHGKDGWHTAFAIAVCLTGIFILSSGMQRYLFRNNRLYESALLFFAGVLFIAPHFILSLFMPPYFEVSPIDTSVFALDRGEQVKVSVKIKNFNDSFESRSIVSSIEEPVAGNIHEIIGTVTGIVMEQGSDNIASINPDSEAFSQQITQKHQIVRIELPSKQISIEYFYLFATLVVIGISACQIRLNRRLRVTKR